LRRQCSFVAPANELIFSVFWDDETLSKSARPTFVRTSPNDL
jgi:hypothetical protein